jgi:hypothetical protein
MAGAYDIVPCQKIIHCCCTTTVKYTQALANVCYQLQNPTPLTEIARTSALSLFPRPSIRPYETGHSPDTQTAAFILASSSALNQACSFLVLNHASSSIIKGAMSNQLGMSKKQKPFSCQRKLNEPIKPKEIFDTVWPDGYDSNPLYGQDPDYYVNSGIPPTQKPVYVSCPKCHWHISSSSITRYSNPICHIISCCGGVTYLHSLVRAAGEDASLKDGKEARKQRLHEAVCQENPQDLALHTWTKLVCLHNTPIHKMNNSGFCDVINCKRTSHKTFTDTMLELSMIVEKKIAA